MRSAAVPWSTDRARWWTQITTWLEPVVTAMGESVVHVESVKERPWGAVLRACTNRRVLYVKAVGPGGRHELSVIAGVASRWPELVPTVLAVDESQGRFVMADHGQPMGDVLDGRAQVALVERLLPAYAQMQDGTVDHVERWLDAGTPDRRVHRLPELVEDLLAGHGRLGRLAVDAEERTGLRRLLPQLERVCEELAATSCPHALDHADLHGTNVLVDSTGGCLADWGDSCISHPFSSLLVPSLLLLPLLPAAERPTAARRLRDAYLEPWGPVADHRSAFDLAVWIGHVARAISVDDQNAGGSPADTADAKVEIAMLLRRWQATRPGA